ncbi:hypothetical protein SIN8267_01093 [Sinobacterium norvegicum]|uniref:GST N-terminal domain-containing protein n=1 Tax=Sinobacterium norvegicum TaxID=1641715 RepID=A0ABM9ACT0_9GAMM|nr:glutathione S-transferase family protein [Sinobacterium norvegicum]CAH0990992.1 hypothetical protein SIN8267_01093 [Sinobacterium norvegicum]
MYTLHIANRNYSSWSLRPWLLMKALAIPFEEVVSPFEQAVNWQAFRAFSPTGQVPCLVDNGNAIWDSLAIIEYLAEQHDAVWPADRDARAWARCASAEMHAGFTALRNICPMNCAITVEMHSVSAALQKDIDRLDELWTEGLKRFNGPYLAGQQFTAVDAFYAPVVFRLNSYSLPLSQPCQDYVARLLAHAPMQQWYQQALTETWREEAHEQEAAEAGTVIEDRRLPAKD